MSDWEYGYLIAGINNPAFQKHHGTFAIKTVALLDRPVTTIGGLRVIPDTTVTKLKPGNSAMLVLPGGTKWDKNKNMEAAILASEYLTRDIPVAAICGATAGLARLGLLDETEHTSNSKDYIAATGYQGGIYYRDAPCSHCR